MGESSNAHFQPTCHNMLRSGISLPAVALTVLMLFVAQGSAQTVVDFDRHVLPILKTHCGGCHNQDDYEAGFSVDSYSDLEDGVDGESVIVAGDANSSRIIQLITGDAEPLMPPDSQPSPTSAEIKVLKRWIDQGANESKKMEQGSEPLPQQSAAPPNEAPPKATRQFVWSARNALAVTHPQGVQILDGTTRKPKRVLPHSGGVVSMQFSQEGDNLLVTTNEAGQGGSAALWHVEGERPEQVFRELGTSLGCSVWNPGTSRLFTGGNDGSLQVWNLGNGKLVRTLGKHDDAIVDLHLIDGSKTLIAASANHSIKVWTLDGKCMDTLQPFPNGLQCLAVSPDQKWIAAGGSQGQIVVWAIQTEDKTQPLLEVKRWQAHSESIVHLAFTPDSNHLLSSIPRSEILKWSSPEFEQPKELTTPSNFTGGFAIAPSGNRILVSNSDGSFDSIPTAKE